MYREKTLQIRHILDIIHGDFVIANYFVDMLDQLANKRNRFRKWQHTMQQFRKIQTFDWTARFSAKL